MIMAAVQAFSDNSSCDLSEDASVTESAGSDEPPSSRDAMDGIDSHDSQDAWGTDDSVFDGTGTPTSESIQSSFSSESIQDDADELDFDMTLPVEHDGATNLDCCSGDGAPAEGYGGTNICAANWGALDDDRKLVDSMTDQLTSMGWSQDSIRQWMKHDQDMAKAMNRLDVQTGAESADECEPPYRSMLDGGCFKHMWGTAMVHLLTNFRKVAPVPCRIAKGFMWLDTMADLVLNGVVLTDGFVNPHHDMSLISEGTLALFEGWEFRKNAKGLVFSVHGSEEQKAWRQGVLFYLPSHMYPEYGASYVAEGNPLFGHDSAFDQSAIEGWDNEMAAALWYSREAQQDEMNATGPDMPSDGEVSMVRNGIEAMAIDELNHLMMVTGPDFH